MDEKSKALRKKRTVYPKVKVFENVGKFMDSKNCSKNFNVLPDEGRELRSDIQLDLTSAQRAYQKTAEILEQKRKVAKEAQIHITQQWEELNKDEAQFRQGFIAMNNFIVTNKNKRDRAVEILQQYRHLVKRRSQKVDDLKTELNIAKQLKRDMEEDIKKLSIYEKYLDTVTSDKMDFKNSDDILERYESLITTRNYVADREKDIEQEIQNFRLRILKIMEERRMEYLGMYNKVADLRQRFLTVFQSSRQWEKIVENIKNYSTERYKEINVVKGCCQNLVKMMSLIKGDRINKEVENNVEMQLVFIKRTMELSRKARQKRTALGKSFT